MTESRVRRTSAATVAQTVVSRFAVVGLNVVTGILTARLLAPEGRGEFVAIGIWPILVGGVTTLGMPSALVYHGRRNPDKVGEYTASAMTLAAIAGLVGTAIAWFLVPFWLHQYPPAVITAARYCLLCTVVSTLTVVGRAAWEARGDFRSSNLSQVAPPALTIVGLVVLAASGTLTSFTAAAVYLGAGIPVVLWMLLALVEYHGLTRQTLRSEWSELLRYGGRSYGIDLFGVLAMYLDQALVVGLLSSAAMGIYAVALSLSRIINTVHGAAATLTFPAVVGSSNEVLTAVIARAARLAAVAAAVIGIVVVAMGPTLVGLLYGSAYVSAGALLPLLVLQVIVAGVVQVLLQGLLAAGRPGLATIAQFAGLALGLPLFLVLTPMWGAVGAAMSLLLSTLIRLVLTMACYPLWLHAPVPRIWIDRTDVTDLMAQASSLLRLRPGGRLRTGAAE